MKDLTKVGSLDVVTREKAKVDVGPNVGSEHRSVDVLMLEDSSIIYQCMSTAAPDCTYTNERAIGVVSHQKSHSGKMIARQKQAEIDAATARAAAAEAELAARKQRRSEGSRKGAETRRNAKAEIPTPDRPVQQPAEIGKSSSAKSAIGDVDLARKAQNVITAYNALRVAEDQFQSILIGYMRSAQVATERPKSEPIDPVILEKAKKYDELQKLLGK